MASRHARSSRNRPWSLRLGAGQAQRPRAPADRETPAACRRRPGALAAGTRRGAKTSTRPASRRSFGNWAGRMTKRTDSATAEQLLSVEAAAERLDTKPRFIRRLIAERRIEFVRVGRHVRISESTLSDFIDAGKVPPRPCGPS